MRTLLDSAKLEFQQRFHRIHVFPIVALCLNNICDSRCGTCAIWKNNDLLKLAADRQMPEALLRDLYELLAQWRPRQVLLSGGEPALHPSFTEVIWRVAAMRAAVCLITNGLLLNTFSPEELRPVSEFYVSFDAPDRESYREIRGVDGFDRLARSVQLLNSLAPRPKIIARCTLQRRNVGRLGELIDVARQFGFDMISFLGLDLSSEAFALPVHGAMDAEKIRPNREDLEVMRADIDTIRSLTDGFVEGGAAKLKRLHQYFRALIGEADFPAVDCNAPWVSTVIETTGKIRGCFFQPVIGDFRTVNGSAAVRFRRSLNVASDRICQRCVGNKMLRTREFIRMC